MPNIIDLFSGVGGISLGFQQAGFNVLVANEIDKDISESYKKNHPNIRMINEDITKLNIETIFEDYKSQTDVIVGGPPCQGFSQKGARKLFDDERNFLFNYFYKVVAFVRPSYFLMENVPNILSAGNKSFKNEIYNLFEELGYTLDSNVLNAADFGVPQNRRRAFILGKLDGSLELPKKTQKNITINDAISDLAFLNSGEGKLKQSYKIPPQSDYQKLMRKNSNVLYNHVATKHSQVALERLKLIPPGKGREMLPEEHLTKSIYSGTWSRMLEDSQSVTITTRFDTPSSGRFTHPFLDRAITVREAARIQSFPDDFIFFGNKSSQMKQVGNAVPPLLAKEIAKVIMQDLKDNDNHK